MSGWPAAALGAVIGSAGASKLLARETRSDQARSSSRWSGWRLIGVGEIALGVVLMASRSQTAAVVAVAFLVGATGYLSLQLGRGERGACACWGASPGGPTTAANSDDLLEALRPSWYFARNGTLVFAGAHAAEWGAGATTGAVAAVWLLLLTGTAASTLRLRLDGRGAPPDRASAQE